MLLAGHMVLAYLLNQVFNKQWLFTYSIPLVFCASILPDLDFIFGPIVPHHTLTHSLTFWGLLCIILVCVKGLNGLPYVVALLSHFLIGDIITGNPTLFYGLSNETFGNFRTNITSQYGEPYGMLYQAAVDAIMVGSFVGYVIIKKNLPPLFSFPLKHVLIFGLVVLLIIIGTIKGQILYLAKNQNDITNSAYAIIVLSQVIFMAVITKGTTIVSIRPFTRTDTQ